MRDKIQKTDVLSPFIDSAIDTFEKMLGLKITAGEVKSLVRHRGNYDVSGIIGVTGELTGTVGLGFDRKTAETITKIFTGEKSVTTDMLIDAVGELANIIAGSAKAELEPVKIRISLPSVVLGDSHELNSPAGASLFIVPFSSPAGNFELTACYKTLNGQMQGDGKVER